MRRKIVIILTFLMAVLLTMTGCAVDNYTAINIKGKQDTSYAVTSNGGSAVKYGNYVYFINGSRGYEDDKGTANKFGSVVKGGLYRAELINETENGGRIENYYADGVDEFVPYDSEQTGLSLATEEKLSYKNKKQNVVKNQLLVPKTIGTSGYADGGIYIFDDYVYYATPANTKDKNGNIMDDYTLFLRTKLDGSVTEEIYTTQNSASDKPYGFYKYNGKIYLVALENNTKYGNYINVIDVKSKKVKTVATNVDSVIFPTNPLYYNGMENNTVYDAIYIRYAINDFPAYKDDPVNRTGYVLAYMRPDGNGDIVSFAGEDGNSTVDIVAVRDGLVFYKDVENNETVLRARDYESIFAPDKTGFNGAFYGGSSLSSAKQIYPFRQGAGAINTNAISMLTVTSSSSSSASGTSTTQTLTYYSVENKQGKVVGTGSAIAVQNHDNSGFYYVLNDGTNNNLRYYNLSAGATGVKTISSNVGSTALNVDKIGSYIVYNATLEEKFEDYTFFSDVSAEDYDLSRLFVGTRLKADVRSSIEKIEVYEDTLADVKTAYDTGDKLSVKNLKIALKYYENDEGVVDEKIVDVKSSWVTGFDSSSASQSQTLTITYTDGVDTFTTTYDVSIS